MLTTNKQISFRTEPYLQDHIVIGLWGDSDIVPMTYCDGTN